MYEVRWLQQSGLRWGGVGGGGWRSGREALRSTKRRGRRRDGWASEVGLEVDGRERGGFRDSDWGDDALRPGGRHGQASVEREPGEEGWREAEVK